ncbi:MAG TPA: endonuclease/exonuclease/phosphatase family protein, partial [Arachnia sp.]|nr:endonuclease/exonuclease/phosphatase family protein [Arachnia sp.]
MIRIGTHNVNGIRAALRRGFCGYWDETAADVVALQEVRCRVDDLPLEAFDGFHVTLDAGQLAGRNGVAILTRHAPERVRSLAEVVTEVSPGGRPTDLSAERIVNRDLAAFSHEGRYVEVDLADAPVRVASLYLPKGAAWPYEEGTEEKYLRKMRFMRGLARALTASKREAAAEGREFLVMGDFNIAHTKQDLRNWR